MPAPDSLRGPWTCPKCKVAFPNAFGHGTHLRYCGKQDENLWARIDKNHPSGCWVYSGATDRRGYGRPATKLTTGKNKRYYAHRRIYELEVGPIPNGMLVLHKCDNPPCCNPAHLFLGTDADNHADKVRKGRASTILTLDQVREIRAALANGKRGINAELARKYGVSATLIYGIKTGRHYANLA